MDEQLLRKAIRDLISESSDVHRCLDGRVVPSNSEDCYLDILDRIDDATYHRDLCARGTSSRSNYNGMLADLRKKERALKKRVFIEAKDTRPEVARARITGLRNKNIKKIMQAEQDPLEHVAGDYSLKDMRRFVKTIWAQHADTEELQKALNIVHWIGWDKQNQRNFEKFESFAASVPPNNRSSNEISCGGYLGTPYYHGLNTFGVLLSKSSKITIASNRDLYTEEFRTATEEVIEYYSNSGVPKRPAPSVNPLGLIFSTSDIEGDSVHELVCDNWSWEGVIIGNDSYFDSNLKKKLMLWCQSNNVKFYEYGDLS